MYPLNVTNAAQGGFAVANNADEHAALTAMGYEPKLVAPEHAETGDLADVRAKLDAAGIKYDKRWGLEKLKALLG